jgi:hypothetical protein
MIDSKIKEWKKKIPLSERYIDKYDVSREFSSIGIGHCIIKGEISCH